MGLFSFLKKKSAVDAVLDPDKGHLSKLGSWIDNQQFTAEERAEMMVGVTTAVREFAIATASENTERSKARREISLLWIKTQLALVMLSAICKIFGLDAIAEHLWVMASSVLMIAGTSGILTFYVGTYGYGSYMRGKK